MATSRILGLDGQPIDLTTLQEEIAAPSVTGIRQVWRDSVADNLTPGRLANILSAAASGDADAYLTLAEDMEERDPHYASVLGTRKLAVAGLDVRVESFSDKPEDVRRADAVRALVWQPEFGEMIAHLTDALGKGYAVAEILWDRSGREWQPTFAARDPRFFRYDQDTGTELRLLDELDAALGIPLPPYKFIVHTPKIRAGLPIRGGLARLAATAYLCKAWTWRDWMAFADIFGLPMRVGRYNANASAEDIRKLMAAVANLGSDAAGVMPESTRIEFQQAAQTAGAGDFFDKLASFWDRQVSKAVLGQTMTTDDGSSLAQAKVHDDVRLDILDADARAMSNTLNRQLVRPFCQLNFGDGDMPRLSLVVPEPEDTAALVNAVATLVPLGLKVEQSVMRDRLNLPDPADGAELLGMPAAKPQDDSANNRDTATNAETPRTPDFLDALAERLADTAGGEVDAWIVRIRDEVNAANGFDDLLGRLSTLLTDLPLDTLGVALTDAFGVAHRAGAADAVDDSRA